MERTYSRVTGCTWSRGSEVYDTYTARTEGSSTSRPFYWGDLCSALMETLHVALPHDYSAKVTIVMDLKLSGDVVCEYTLLAERTTIPNNENNAIFNEWSVIDSQSVLYHLDRIKHMNESIVVESIDAINYQVKVYDGATQISSFSVWETGSLSWQDFHYTSPDGTVIYYTIWSKRLLYHIGEIQEETQTFTIENLTSGLTKPIKILASGSTSTASTTGVRVTLVPKRQYTGQEFPSWCKDQIISDYTYTTTITSVDGAILDMVDFGQMTYEVIPIKAGWEFYQDISCSVPAPGTFTLIRSVDVTQTSTYYNYYKTSSTRTHYIFFTPAEAIIDDSNNMVPLKVSNHFVPSSIVTYDNTPFNSGNILKYSLSFSGTQIYSTTSVSATTPTYTIGGYQVLARSRTAAGGRNICSVEVLNGPINTQLPSDLFEITVNLSNEQVPNQPLTFSQYYALYPSNTEVINYSTNQKFFGIPVYDKAKINNDYTKIANVRDMTHKIVSHYYDDLREYDSSTFTTPYDGYQALLGMLDDGIIEALTTPIIDLTNQNDLTVGYNILDSSGALFESWETLYDVLSQMGFDLTSSPVFASITPVLGSGKQAEVPQILSTMTTPPVVTLEALPYNSVYVNVENAPSITTLSIYNEDNNTLICNLNPIVGEQSVCLSGLTPGFEYKIYCLAVNGTRAVSSNTVTLYDNWLFNVDGNYTEKGTNTAPKQITSSYGTLTNNGEYMNLTVSGASTSRNATLIYSGSEIERIFSSIRSGGDFTVVTNSQEIAYSGNKYSNHITCDEFSYAYTGTSATRVTTRPVANISWARFGTGATGQSIIRTFAPKSIYVSTSDATWYSLVENGGVGSMSAVTTSASNWYGTEPPKTLGLCQLHNSNTALEINIANARVYNGKIADYQAIGSPNKNEIWFSLTKNVLIDSIQIAAQGQHPKNIYFVPKIGMFVAVFQDDIVTFEQITSTEGRCVTEIRLPFSLEECKSGVDNFEALVSYGNVYTFMSQKAVSAVENANIKEDYPIRLFKNGVFYETVGCFVAGTKVSIDLSGNTANIEDLQVGDRVVSLDINTNELYETTIKKLIVKNDSYDIATITTSNGNTLTMTANHPLLTTDGWHSITMYGSYETLRIGDVLITENGEDEIVAIDLYRNVEPITTYSIDVIDDSEDRDDDKNDNFIVNGIIAHNAC